MKAGANNSAGSIDQNEGWVKWISGAEAFVNVMTRKNWSDEYATLSDDVKHILDDCTSSLVAIQAISYDMSGYTSRGEAESMINVQRDNALRQMSLLRDIKQQTFMEGE